MPKVVLFCQFEIEILLMVHDNRYHLLMSHFYTITFLAFINSYIHTFNFREVQIKITFILPLSHGPQGGRTRTGLLSANVEHDQHS